MANISSLLEIIRTAHLGRDMRQALHDSIQAVNNDTETALGKSLTFTNATRKLSLKAKDGTVLSEATIPGGGSGGGSVDSVNGVAPDENGNVQLTASDVGAMSSSAGLNDISDVTLSSPSNGQVLGYDGSKWKNVSVPSGGGEDISAIVNVYGSKNLNSYPYYESTQTISGLTITDNGDGSVTVSGTANANVNFGLHHNSYITNQLSLNKGDYILSGCPSGGASNKYYLSLWTNDLGYANDYGSGKSFSISADNTIIWFAIVIKNGTDLTTPITFRPMLRDARITDDTYVPYAMTNRELTKLQANAVNVSFTKYDTNFTVSPNTTYTQTLHKGQALVLMGSSQQNQCGAYLVFNYSSQRVIPLHSASDMVVSVTNGVLSVQNNNTSYGSVCALRYMPWYE